ncbi:hypothetical protein [Desulfuribacillus alkaliarsenatis]|uniref:Uncharacterized protein n=1 Tax=Desulfuribacillus alkaliarsenatis TaxID=766136 RepID=A0A1E5G4B5_9FIRM|nr:hypothetical protein [Desulfuribacillus alkaliarsenatis]OEF97509.1 hypothetical protein BHF68_04700 [Desulfuribacillus alkaliarsenatis]
MGKKIVGIPNAALQDVITTELDGMKFTKNFRSATAEEWYVFLPSYKDPATEGAVGKAIIHYDLYGNRDVFINTTLILDDPKLHETELRPLVYAIGEEIVNRLVGYADTLLSIHAGANSLDAEFIRD